MNASTVTMLIEAAQDARDALKLLLVRLSDDRKSVDLINAHIAELEFALRKAGEE